MNGVEGSWLLLENAIEIDPSMAVSELRMVPETYAVSPAAGPSLILWR